MKKTYKLRMKPRTGYYHNPRVEAGESLVCGAMLQRITSKKLGERVTLNISDKPMDGAVELQAFPTQDFWLIPWQGFQLTLTKPADAILNRLFGREKPVKFWLSVENTKPAARQPKLTKPCVCTEEKRLCMGEENCPAVAPGDTPYLCTRPTGHKGLHVACGCNTHNLATWPSTL